MERLKRFVIKDLDRDDTYCYINIDGGKLINVNIISAYKFTKYESADKFRCEYEDKNWEIVEIICYENNNINLPEAFNTYIFKYIKIATAHYYKFLILEETETTYLVKNLDNDNIFREGKNEFNEKYKNVELIESAVEYIERQK